MSVIDELVTLIGFDMPSSSTAALRKAESGISRLTGRIKDLGIVSVATGAVTAALSVNAANDANELSKLSEATGLSTERLQALAAVYKEVGGSAANAGRDAAAFYNLSGGMKLDEDSVDMLSEYIAGMNDAEAIRTLTANGFSQDIFRFLNMSKELRKERMDYNRENNTLSGDELDKLKTLSTAMAAFTTELGDTSSKMQAALAPTITTALDDIVAWLDENEGKIVGGMEAIAGGFSKAWGTFKDFGKGAQKYLAPAWTALDAFVTKRSSWEEAIAGVTLAVGGMGTAFAAIKIPAALLSLITGIGRGGTAAAGVGAATAGSAGTALAGAGGAAATSGTSAAGGWAGWLAGIAVKASAAAVGGYLVNEGIVALKDGRAKRYYNSILGDEKQLRNIDKIIAGMSKDEKHAYRNSEDFDPAVAERLDRLGWGRMSGLPKDDIDKVLDIEEKLKPENDFLDKVFLPRSVNENRLRAERDEIIGRASPVNVNITVNGVRGADEAADRIGEAAEMGTQSAIQTAMKMTHPSGYWGTM